jgi:DNA-binding CsgD family transcriptional regulator
MNVQKKEHFIIWSNGLYFGWILSFPYFGVFLKEISSALELDFSSLTLAFFIFHAAGFLVGAFFLKNTDHWQSLMYGSLISVIVLSAILWFAPISLWLPLMALIGFCSPFYILGWGCLIASYPSAEKMKIIMHFVIRANIIVVFSIYLSTVLEPASLHLVVLLPLLAALVVLFVLMPAKDEAISHEKGTADNFLSFFFIPALIIFIILLNMTLAFFYTVINNSYPAVSGNTFTSHYYRFIPYLAPFFYILIFKRNINLKNMIYFAVSLTGLAYVLFVILGDSIFGFYLTITAIQIGYNLFSLFVWLLIGNLSTRYKAPFRFFGLGLFSILLGTFLGGFLSEYYYLQGDAPELITALSAIAAIFVALLLLPWLLEQSTEIKDSSDQVNVERLMSDQHFLDELYLKAGLTPREIEIVGLLMEGCTNQAIAEKLYISENTLKTHLRNIYRKTRVRKKSELLALIASKTLPRITLL